MTMAVGFTLYLYTNVAQRVTDTQTVTNTQPVGQAEPAITNASKSQGQPGHESLSESGVGER